MYEVRSEGGTVIASNMTFDSARRMAQFHAQFGKCITLWHLGTRWNLISSYRRVTGQIVEHPYLGGY
jgi:hypothetical protein